MRSVTVMEVYVCVCACVCVCVCLSLLVETAFFLSDIVAEVIPPSRFPSLKVKLMKVLARMRASLATDGMVTVTIFPWRLCCRRRWFAGRHIKPDDASAIAVSKAHRRKGTGR